MGYLSMELESGHREKTSISRPHLMSHPLGFSPLGLGWAFVFTPMMATVMRSFTRRRSLALSLGSAGSGIGCFVSTPLFQLLADTYTWRGSLFILGGLSLNLVVCGALIPPQGGSKAVAQVGQVARLIFYEQ